MALELSFSSIESRREKGDFDPGAVAHDCSCHMKSGEANSG
jgi:hypothetical protein